MKRIITWALALALALTLCAVAAAETITIPSNVNPQQMGHPAYLEALYGTEEAQKILRSYGGTPKAPTRVVYPLAGWVIPGWTWGVSAPSYASNPGYVTTPWPGYIYNATQDPYQYIWQNVQVTPTAVYAPYVYPYGPSFPTYTSGVYSVADAGSMISDYIHARWDKKDIQVFGSFNDAYNSRYSRSWWDDLDRLSDNNYISHSNYRSLLERIDTVLAHK